MSWLTGEKTKMRAIEPTDLDLMYKWENNSDFWHVSDTLTPYSKFILKEFIENAPKNLFEARQIRLIIDKTDGGSKEPIGAMDLFDYDPYHNRANIGIYIDSSIQGKGYGSDALKTMMNYTFNYLHLKQLFCHIGADNEGSLNFFKKAGFTECGLIKSWLRGIDGYVDSYLMQAINEKI